MSIKSVLKFVIFSVILIIGVNGDCKMTIEEADTCAMHVMIFGNRDADIPTTEAELDTHCAKVTGNMKCLHDYSETCLKGLHQQIANMALTASDKHIETQCKGPERATLLKNMKCLLPKEKIEPLHVCSDKNIIHTEKLKDIPDNDDRMAASCCSFHEFQECLKVEATKICGAETADYYETLLDEASDETISFACGAFQSLDDCNKKMKPDIWKMMKEITNSNDPKVLASRHKYKSVLAPMIEVINKFQ